MKSIEKFISIWQPNWIIGRHLIPRLAEFGYSGRGTVLDLGCGQSPFLNLFPQAKMYIRIDRNAVDEGVVVANITELPLHDESVDVILLLQVMSDIPNTEDFLKEVARVLRVGGHMIVFESMCYPEHDMPHDYFRIMPAGIEYLSMKAGFKCSEMVRLGGLFARCAMLWNVFIMGRIIKFPVIGRLAYVGIFLANIIFFILDRLFNHPRLAPDYIARFVKRT